VETILAMKGNLALETAGSALVLTINVVSQARIFFIKHRTAGNL
jgi:hypothetical protein